MIHIENIFSLKQKGNEWTRKESFDWRDTLNWDFCEYLF
jgi:hypothetical protein